MKQAPYSVVEADEQRPLTIIQVRVYADRIISTELGQPYAVHGTLGEAVAEIEARCARARAS
jgi:hypothetical protein